MSHDRPSLHGKVVGEFLANLVDNGSACRAPEGEPSAEELLKIMCGTCALKRGSMANQMAGTALDAAKIAIGVDPVPFGCHHGMENGRPTRMCAGMMIAKRAHQNTQRALLEKMNRQLKEITTDKPEDTIRADFDEWRGRVDPEGRMDNHQLARLWEKRSREADRSKPAGAVCGHCEQQLWTELDHLSDCPFREDV